jgi:hypothetical protein
VVVKNRSRRVRRGTRAALAGLALTGTLLASLGVAVSTSGALGNSAFCKTLFGYETTYAKDATPPTSISGYGKWAKTILPFYEKLASEAPTAGAKSELNALVKIIKYEASDKSLAGLGAYVAANHVKFEKSIKYLASAIEACA